MLKTIKNYSELLSVCKSAGLWYVGSFMSEFLDHKDMWENKETKGKFIAYIYKEYGGGDSDITGTRTRANCVIRIIESKKVKEALNIVLEANDLKLGCAESKINAKETLEEIESGKYPWYIE
jgi:hypothetical protein